MTINDAGDLFRDLIAQMIPLAPGQQALFEAVNWATSLTHRDEPPDFEVFVDSLDHGQLGLLNSVYSELYKAVAPA